jgi:hypothetical protein
MKTQTLVLTALLASSTLSLAGEHEGHHHPKPAICTVANTSTSAQVQNVGFDEILGIWTAPSFEQAGLTSKFDLRSIETLSPVTDQILGVYSADDNLPDSIRVNVTTPGSAVVPHQFLFSLLDGTHGFMACDLTGHNEMSCFYSNKNTLAQALIDIEDEVEPVTLSRSTDTTYDLGQFDIKLPNVPVAGSGNYTVIFHNDNGQLSIKSAVKQD